MRTSRINLTMTVCALLVLCSMVTDALATDYFVRKTGNNGNAGTSAGAAWLTIDYAADSMSAGDTVYVGAGTYSERVTPSPSGTSGSPIRYIADIDGTQTGDAGDVLVTGSSGLQTLVLSNKDYLEFDSFKFKGFGDDAVRVYFADGIVLDNCEIYGGTQGINVTGGYNLTVRNCIIRDNSKDGINTATVTGMLVSRCEIYGNVMGIDVDSGGVTIRNCLLRDNSSRGIDLTVGTAVVQNCTLVSNTTDGIHEGSGTLTITNSIVANNGDDGIDADAGSITHTYNLVYGNSGLDFEGTSLSTGEISDDPLFVSSTDYRITLLSPARNAGTDLTGTVDDDLDGRSRPYDGAHDIGCYEEGPDGHYKLDETSGTVAVDSSGFSNDGTYTNSPTLGAAGSVGTAVDFDGVNDYVEVPGSSNLQVTDMTLSAWVYIPTSMPSGFRAIFEHGRNTSNWYGLYKSGVSDVFHFRWGNSGTFVSDFDTTIVPDQWYFVTATYNSSTSEARLYLNGQLDKVVTGATAPTPTAGNLRIGRTLNDAEEFLGTIDDARIYSRALSDTEIALLADNSGLVGHWKLDETSGTVAADSSTYGNDGTVNGTATWASAVHDNGLDVDYTDGDDYVEIPNSSSLENVQEGSYTLAAWFRPASTPPGSGADNDAAYSIVRKEGWSIGLFYDDLNRFKMAHYLDGNVYAGTNTYLSNPYAPGKFYHVVGVVDRSAGTTKIYVDGKLVNTATFTAGTAAREFGTNPWLLGISKIASASYRWAAQGTLDDARIYNRALTATEIAELYGLMGHWKMDEGSGSTATDSTAFANDATLYGATWTTDCAGNSGLEFDGISDTAATNAAFDPPERGAIAMWFRSDGAPAARQRLWGVGDDFEMWQDPDGFVCCDVSTNGFLGGFITTDPLHMDGRWYHLIAEYDSDDDSYAIYINGALHKSGISTWAITKQVANTLTFGTRTGMAEYFEGGIRDFRIYNRSLTPSEKSELSGLAAYWKLDETSGTVAVDSSYGGHDGTLVGSPTWTTAGNVDGALDFEIDDGDDRVEAGTFDVSGSALSVSAWVRSEEGVHDGRIVFKSTGNDSADQFWGFTIGESLEPDFRIRAGGTRNILAYSGAVSPGKWYYLVGTYDGTTMRLYVNGVEVNSMVHSVGGALDEDSTATVALGDSPIGSRALDGRLDDVRIFSRVLCPTEIYGQYKSGRPGGIRILKWVEVR